VTLSAPGLRPALIASASASGAVGSVLLAQLLAGPAYGEIHALVRRPVPVPPSADTNKVIQHIVDYANPGITQAILAIDDVYICLGKETPLKMRINGFNGSGQLLESTPLWN